MERLALNPGRASDPSYEFETFHEEGAGRISDTRREYLLDLVEDIMLTGVNRPRTVLKLVNSNEAQRAQRGITDIRTAKNYMDLVYERWRTRSAGDLETQRARLLAELDAAAVKQHQIIIAAQREQNLNAQVGASRNLVTVYEKRAELLGLRTLTLKPDPDFEARMQRERYAELISQQSADPVSDLYGAVLQDSRQGHGVNDPVPTERPPTTNT